MKQTKTKEQIMAEIWLQKEKAIIGRELADDKSEWRFSLSTGHFARIRTNINPFLFDLLPSAKSFHEATKLKPLHKKFLPAFPIESIAAATRAIFSILRQYTPDED